MPTPEEITRDTMNKIINMLRERGDRVDRDTDECVSWKTKHSNCCGCPSELGCIKVARLLALANIHVIYKTEQHLPDIEATRQITTMEDHILNTKTVEELRAIPLVPSYLKLKSKKINLMASLIEKGS